MTTPRGVAAAATLVGAIMVVATISSSSPQLREGDNRWALVVVVPLSFLLVAAYRQVTAVVPAGFGPLTLAGVGLIGAACVPETGQFFELVPMCVGLAVIEVISRHPITPPWAVLAAGGIMMWGLLYGSVGRPSAIVGASFAWWPLVIAGAVALVTSSRWHTVAAVAFGGIAAAVVARTGGVSDSGSSAARWAVGAALASMLVVAVSLFVPGGPAGARPRSPWRQARFGGESHPST